MNPVVLNGVEFYGFYTETKAHDNNGGIHVTPAEKSAWNEVANTAVRIAGIRVRQNPQKMRYIYGQTFDPSGMIVETYYTNGMSQALEDGTYSYDTEPIQQNEKADITISFEFSEELTFETKLEVAVDPSISKITVSRLPTKTVYNFGEALDTTGMRVRVTKTNGETTTISSGFEVGGIPQDKLGEVPVEVSYSDEVTTKTTSFMVTVKGDLLTPTCEPVEYNGSVQSPVWVFPQGAANVSGDTEKTDVGHYTAVFTLLEGFRWKDGEYIESPTEIKQIPWEIVKAENSIKSISIEGDEVVLDEGKMSAVVEVNRLDNGAISAEVEDESLVKATVKNNKITIKLGVDGYSNRSTNLTIKVGETANCKESAKTIKVTTNFPISVLSSVDEESVSLTNAAYVTDLDLSHISAAIEGSDWVTANTGSVYIKWARFDKPLKISVGDQIERSINSASVKWRLIGFKSVSYEREKKKKIGMTFETVNPLSAATIMDNTAYSYGEPLVNYGDTYLHRRANMEWYGTLSESLKKVIKNASVTQKGYLRDDDGKDNYVDTTATGCLFVPNMSDSFYYYKAANERRRDVSYWLRDRASGNATSASYLVMMNDRRGVLTGKANSKYYAMLFFSI